MSPARPASIDLSALAGALAELGPERASTAGLAHAAGVAKPTLYTRFGSREGLVQACVEHEAEKLLDRVYGSTDPGPGLAGYARQSPGWRLLLLARHPAARAARSRVAARMAEGRSGGAGLRPQAAASAFLAAAATVLESEPAPAAPRALRSLASALLPPRRHTEA
jgi:AcrR family transcriptional regulator